MNLKKYIDTFVKYNNLLRKLISRDIKVRYRKSVLGLLWTILNPLLMMIIMSIVFSKIFNMTINNFPVYVMIGNIIFNFHSEATSQAIMSILSNASLIKKVYIPKYLFPLSKVLSALINLSFSFIALLLVMIFTKMSFHWTILLVWIPLIYLFMFVLGISMILASINVYFRDIGHLYSVLLTAWTYLTPIFYDFNIIPQDIKIIINMNPLYHFITFFRKIIMDGTIPTINENVLCFLMGLCFLLIGCMIFKKMQNKFILYI